MAATPERPRLPARGLPLLYWGFAHLALATAWIFVLGSPRHVAGFYYHPRMIAVVHLVTLGWITCSILGALYLIAPMALRAALPARRIDFWGFALVAAGISGMVAHFWIDEASGMAWSAGTLLVGLAIPSFRFLAAVRPAPIPFEVKLLFRCAFLNLLAAATLGLLLGIHKAAPFLPGYVLASVWAHAHLAALGWATLMVVAAGHRLLPMLLPSAMPEGRAVLATALLLETGVVGLFVSLLAQSRWVAPFAALSAAGLGSFLLRVRWMLRHRRPSPPALRRPDLGVVQVFVALCYLAVGAGLGLALAFAPEAPWKLSAAMVYGVAFLLGFLSQMVVGVAARLLPMASWIWAYADSGFAHRPPALHDTPARPLQVLVLALWLIGVPLLACALAFSAIGMLRAAAALLLAAVVLGAASHVLVLTRSRSRPVS